MFTAETTADSELGIWERIFIPDPKNLTPEQTRYLLKIRFPRSDLDRINFLSAKANEGNLTLEERAALDRYVRVGHLLSILKAKVRLRLKEAKASSEPKG